LLHAHLPVMNKYRRPVFTDAMLTFTEPIIRAGCAELDADLVEFNGQAHHMHLLIASTPTQTISGLVPRLNGRTSYPVRRDHTGVCDHARMRGHLWSPSYLPLSCQGAPLSITKQYIEAKHDHSERRGAGDKRDGLTPDRGPRLSAKKVHVITQGLGTICEARHLVLIATGGHKAEAVAAAVEGPLTASCPASVLQLHPHVTAVIDEAAAGQLKNVEFYRYALKHKPAQ